MQSTNEKLYLGVNGKYYLRSELEKAYFLVHGKEYYDQNIAGASDKLLDLWIYDLLGLSIKSIVPIESVSCEDLIRANQDSLACRLYRMRNNCSLSIAYAAIKALRDGIMAVN